MANGCRHFLFYAALVHIASAAVSPPLQWINLSKLLTGSAPPVLKDASIGYDDTTRTLIIFGGESAGGFPVDTTYLLNLDTLTWTTPSHPDGLSQKPAARSQAVSGDDFAASYRNAHVVIGGLGTDGKALSDVWVFDYNQQFWGLVQLSGSGPTVYDAAGGKDLRVAFNPTSTSNTFYLSGGKQSTSSGPVSISDTYSLEISGTLSPNLPNSTTGTWTKQEIGKLNSLSGIGSTVIGQKIITYGGCESSASPDASCATQDAYILDTSTGGSISPAGCAAPRLNPAIVANMNGASSNFNTQVLVMLGTFNSTLWDDGNGLEKNGEDILDVGGGTWTRVLPSGDPSSSPNYPTPRQGAAALSFNGGLVGSSRSSYSDVIVFGGQDASGHYLSDVWILRTYSGSISSSGQHWSGFGNGDLQSGVSANGQGVVVNFNSTCAARVSSPAPGGSSSSTSASSTASGSSTTLPSSSPTSPSSSTPASAVTYFPYDTSISHKVIGPVSLVLALPALILYRLSLAPSSGIPIVGDGSLSLRAVAFAIGASAYGLGVAGFALAFTTITTAPRPSSLTRRSASSSTLLKTAHGVAGLVLFLLLYGVIPVLFLFSKIRAHFAEEEPRKGSEDKAQMETASVGTTEKLTRARTPSANGMSTSGTRSVVTTPGLDFPSRRPTPQKWPALHRPTFGRRHSISSAASEPEPEPGSSGTFEVVNRGHRKRHLSATNTLNLSESSHRMGYRPATRRSLSDVSWLERRRSVAAVSDLDYALSQLNHSQRGAPTPGAADASTQALNGNSIPPSMQAPSMPPATEILLHSALHASLLALTVLSLVAFWQRGQIVAFAIFLALTVVLYGVFIALAWYGRPANSTLTVFLARVRGDGGYTPAPATPMPGDSRPLSPAVQGSGSGPYLNSPPFRSAALQEEDGYVASRHDHLSAEAEGDEDADTDEDEDSRQRRIEDEMARREVSIVTVPRRKLWVANPT
ncbi:hypothetical protein PENSPDRAFT_727607 [Peniophora sp. CONT]|nr:hypothetical protein PENSPDRAFT_727607 [Peniophora sp. CONT]